MREDDSTTNSKELREQIVSVRERVAALQTKLKQHAETARRDADLT
jgi:hypothetical protein